MQPNFLTSSQKFMNSWILLIWRKAKEIKVNTRKKLIHLWNLFSLHFIAFWQTQKTPTSKPNMSLFSKALPKIKSFFLFFFYNPNHLNSIRSLNYCRSIRKQIRKHLLVLSKKIYKKRKNTNPVLFCHREHKCLAFVVCCS